MKILVVNDDYLTVEMIVICMHTHLPQAEVWFVMGANDDELHCALKEDAPETYIMTGWDKITDANVFDVVLMDWNLVEWEGRDRGNICGDTLLRELKERGYTGIILANSADPGRNSELVQLGANASAEAYGRPLCEQIERLLAD